MQLKQGTLLQGGRYRIERVLGQGGFGITYLAEQTGLGRKVAIKEFFMREHCNRDAATSHVSIGSVGSREMVERFKQKFLKEARTIAAFDHPNIVRIHDIFEENDTAYFVMEYLGNMSLADYVNDQPIPEQQALVFTKQIASALQYVHEHHVLHLDVKPTNILLRGGAVACLIDFGVSKRYDEQGGQTSTTPAGISRGYAPLEQYNQDLVQFAPNTDIYSLGATLFKMLTGKTPPDASTVNEDGLPTKPTNVSPAVWQAVTHAMQPRRKDRPQSIADFMGELEVSSEPQPQSREDDSTIIEVMKNEQPKEALLIQIPTNPKKLITNSFKIKKESTPSKLSALSKGSFIWICITIILFVTILAFTINRCSDRPNFITDYSASTDSLLFGLPHKDLLREAQQTIEEAARKKAEEEAAAKKKAAEEAAKKKAEEEARIKAEEVQRKKDEAAAAALELAHAKAEMFQWYKDHKVLSTHPAWKKLSATEKVSITTVVELNKAEKKRVLSELGVDVDAIGSFEDLVQVGSMINKAKKDGTIDL